MEKDLRLVDLEEMNRPMLRPLQRINVLSDPAQGRRFVGLCFSPNFSYFWAEDRPKKDS